MQTITLCETIKTSRPTNRMAKLFLKIDDRKVDGGTYCSDVDAVQSAIRAGFRPNQFAVEMI